jgi:hypothetical protein
MHILESTWLIHMLEKSSNKPAERLVNIFDILDDWVKAPGVIASVSEQSMAGLAPESLLTFLANEAIKLKAEDPNALAYQIYYMAIAALNNEYATKSGQSLFQAKSAAYALIEAQTPNSFFSRLKTKHYAIAASAFICFALIGALLYGQFIPKDGNQIALAEISTLGLSKPIITDKEHSLNPMQVAILFSTIETMRKGSCQFPEAIQIPDKHKAAYIDIVVNGKAPNSVDELLIANQYLKMVRCNYTPMLMSNSRS